MITLYLQISLILVVFAMLSACSTKMPIAYDNNVGSYEKSGESCATGILFFNPIVGQNQSIIDAKDNGNITKIFSVEHTFNFYILFNKSCTVVTGE